METIHPHHRIGPRRRLLAQLTPPLSGAALGVAAAGAALALVDFSSPLRAPLTIFFLLAAPAAAIAAGLGALDPLSRTVLALIGSATLNALVAQLLLATGSWSVRIAVAVIATVSVLALTTRLLLPVHPRAAQRAEETVT